MLVVVVAQLYDGRSAPASSPLTRLDAVWYDVRFQMWPPQRPALVPIVIVDLDEASLQREGRWPWERRRIADLVQALYDRGAALVGFDVVFSEAETNPVARILADAALTDSQDDWMRGLFAQFDGDAALARVLAQRSVLAYFFHADGGQAGTLPPPFLLWPDDAQATTLINLPDYTANLDILSDQALSSGFVVTIPDGDGIVRRVPLVLQHDGGVYASLSLEMSRLALGAPWIRLDLDEQGDHRVVTAVRLGQHVRIPVDQAGSLLVPYRGGARSFPTVSATGVLQDDAPHDLLLALDGAIVLIGTSALGLGDLRTTPLQPAYPGVEVHANVIDTIVYAALQAMNGSGADTVAPGLEGAQTGLSPFYVHPDWEPGATLAVLVITGLLLAFWLPGRTPAVMLASSVVWLAVVVGANVFAWHRWHIALPLALQILLVLALGGFNIVAGHMSANRQRRTIQSLFGEYVPAGHVERMLADPRQVSMAGEQREMTVLFADVRDFTAVSESLSAAQLKSMLNRYLSAVTAVIFEHHGTIDKYVGDLVMAFWNAPLDDPEHARHAVEAALAMQERMVALREEFRQEGLPELHIGIGLNTGMMNVGDMGSRYRRAYTVLGDAVNLAARLESLTAYYKLPVLVGEATRKAVATHVFRTVDRVRVKGRRQAVDISQPLARSGALPADDRVRLDSHERALEDYRRRAWQAAQAAWQALLHDDEHDSLSALYLERMAGMDPDELPAHWQAVHDHENK